MVQAARNRAEIVGEITGIDETPDATGLTKLMVQVEHVNALPGFANMFAWAKGKVLPVLVPNDRTMTLSLRPGRTLKCVVAKVGPNRNYADPDSLSVG